MPRKKEQKPEDYGSPFPSRLREIMCEQGKTQREVADAVGKTRQAVGYYADGSSSPDWKTLVKLAQYFGVSTDWLLGLSEETVPNADVRSVCEFTGLSAWTVEFLHSLYDSKTHSFFKRLFDDLAGASGVTSIPEWISEAAKAHIIAERYSGQDSMKRKALDNTVAALSPKGCVYTIAPDEAEELYLYRAQGVLRTALDSIIEELLLECEDECRNIDSIDGFEWAVEDENDEEGITWNI